MINTATRLKMTMMVTAVSTTRKTILIRRVWNRLLHCTSSNSRCREQLQRGMTTQMRKMTSRTRIMVMIATKRTIWKEMTGRTMMTKTVKSCTCRSTQT